MRRKILVMLWMLTAALSATAQGGGGTFTLKGTVADSLTKEGEPYATVRITQKSDTAKALKMMLTDRNGQFRERISGAGGMTVSISSMGRKTVVRHFTAAAAGQTIDLDTLFISNADNELQQVVVRAQKPLVKADIDKITYSMEDDPDSKSNTALEMLRKVPMVTVDGEENIKVNGSSSFKVYVNGKPNKMMSDNPKDVLKSMPANSIKKIEVITNPGPKYDAEGVGGILNIITTGSGPEGYTVTLNGDVRNTSAGTGAFGTVKQGKLTVSARYSYYYNDYSGNSANGRRTTTGDISASSSDIETGSRSNSYTNSHSGSFEASYEIDTLRLVSAELGLWGNTRNGNNTTCTAATMPLTANELYSYRTLGGSQSSRFSINGGIDYQRTFANVKDRMLTLSYRISTTPSTSDSHTDYRDLRSTEDWEDFMARMREQRTDGKSNSTEQTFQTDFTTPIGKAHTVEAGVKYIIRNNTSENDRYERDANSGGDYEPDIDQSSHYKHRNDIAAAYVGYGLKAGKLSGRLGLRYEHTEQKVELLLGRGTDFSKGFDDLVPSASLGWQLSPMSTLRLGYNMRIYRPGIWYLNPYLDDSNPTYISRGNPNLTSEKTHSVSMSYNNFTQKVNLSFSANYSFTNNSIEGVSELVPDVTLVDKGLQNPAGKDVIYSTYRNIGKSRNVNLSGYVNWNITSSTRIYSNLYARWSYLSDGNGLSNHGWFGYVYGGAQQTLPKDWRISANVFYQTPWIGLQGKYNKWLDYGVNVSKSFLDKRLTLSAFANNFFKKYYRTTWSEQSANFLSENRNRQQTMRYGMSVSFRIGELKAGVRKAERTINNDDVKEQKN